MNFNISNQNQKSVPFAPLRPAGVPGAQPGAQAGTRPGARKPVIVFCFPGREFTPGFFDSWTTTVLRLTEDRRPFDFVMSRSYSPVINHCRTNVIGGSNVVGRKQAPWQGKLNYDYLFWIDSDICFTIEQIMALYNKIHSNPDIKVLSGLYRTQDGVHTTVIKEWDTDHFLRTGQFPMSTPEALLEDGKKDRRGLVKVMGVGMGFMIIRKGVFESIEYPWFGPVFHQIAQSYDCSSEDISLCHKLKDAGIPVYIDPTVLVGHEKTVIIR